MTTTRKQEPAVPLPILGEQQRVVDEAHPQHRHDERKVPDDVQKCRMMTPAGVNTYMLLIVVVVVNDPDGGGRSGTVGAAGRVRASVSMSWLPQLLDRACLLSSSWWRFVIMSWKPLADMISRRNSRQPYREAAGSADRFNSTASCASTPCRRGSRNPFRGGPWSGRAGRKDMMRSSRATSS